MIQQHFALPEIYIRHWHAWFVSAFVVQFISNALMCRTAIFEPFGLGSG
jgi:hypothetical protein